jgi:hypothetical protein
VAEYIEEKRAKKKRQILERASRSVEKFYPELRGVFICPTCLCRRPVDDIREITQAHILPKAAGGRWTTLLCRRCNSTHGTLQDKWFGEYVRLISPPALDIFHAKHQDGYFEVDGQRINGRYQVSGDGGIEFLALVHKNSPEAMRVYGQRMAEARFRGSFQLRFSVPILVNKQVINSAFLTAAYLLWFRELGYSWALQSHLDPIREQIRKPDQQVLPKSFSAACAGAFFETPWIGTGYIAGQLVPMAAIASRMVFFPPADRPDLYALLPEDFSGLQIDGQKLNLSRHNEFEGPFGVLFGDRLIVAPDVLLRGAVAAPMILFPPGGGKPRVLYPISEEEFERRLQQPHAVRIRVQPDIEYLETTQAGERLGL